jgi:hypothetical protein
VVRGLPGHARGGPNRRGPAPGAPRQVRAGGPRGLRRGVVRLLGAADRARHLRDAVGHDRRPRPPRSVRARAGRDPAHRQDRSRSCGRDDRGRPDGQSGLPPRGGERVEDVRAEQLHDRDLQLDRPGHPAQRRHVQARQGEAARELRRRDPHLPPLVLGGDDKRRRAPRRHDPAGRGRRLGRLRPRGGSVRDRPGLRGRVGQGLAKGRGCLREPEVPRLAGRPRRARARRLDHLRERRHERPHVPRQRRDRRAEVPDPRPRNPDSRRLRGGGAAARHAGDEGDVRSETGCDDGGLRHGRLPSSAAWDARGRRRGVLDPVQGRSRRRGRASRADRAGRARAGRAPRPPALRRGRLRRPARAGAGPRPCGRPRAVRQLRPGTRRLRRRVRAGGARRLAEVDWEKTGRLRGRA